LDGQPEQIVDALEVPNKSTQFLKYAIALTTWAASDSGQMTGKPEVNCRYHKAISLTDPFSKLRAAAVLLFVSIQRREYVEVLYSLWFGISVSREKLIAYLTRRTRTRGEARVACAGLLASDVEEAKGAFRPTTSEKLAGNRRS
jgi:hypothetical protein